ncbi:hypothetical protein ACFLEY_22230 [Bradyrhizobium sp. YCK136]|uniref:hypothetical protein n=1 Tax=Bradyrhizobium sp. YCK136 TaxID=3351346 RepID=UPI0037CA3F8F
MTLIEHIRFNIWIKNSARLKEVEDADTDINLMSNIELLEQISAALEDVLNEAGVTKPA